MEIQGRGLRSERALIIATRKGVFYLESDGDHNRWHLSEPTFLGHIVNHAILDPRDGVTLLAGARTGHLGPTIFRSRDAGRTWKEARRPPAFDKATPGQPGKVVSHTFWLSPGHPSEPDTWYAGTSPQALWISRDAGESWSGVRGFNDHPDYELRTEDPQAGTPDGPVLHSILIDPRDARHMYLGLSGGGVYETTDQGQNWQPLNRGLATTPADPSDEERETHPESLHWQEIGPQHDPHCVQMHPADPDILYQQNHCGIYRLQRPDSTWQRIGRNMPPDVGDIGFVVGLHPRDTGTCWVIPMDGTDVWPRTSPGGRPAVYITRDGGSTWQRQDKGLPERGWHTVKRQCMSVDQERPAGVFFGTTSGELWASENEGNSWQCISSHLPEIYSVEVAMVA